MPDEREWLHRVKVYKFGSLWFWRCLRRNCAGGRQRRNEAWADVVTRALNHVTSGGYYEGGVHHL